MAHRQQDAPSEMIREMGLDSQMLDRLQQQQQPNMMPAGSFNPGFQSHQQQQQPQIDYSQQQPQQLQIPQQMQAEQPHAPQQYNDTSSSSLTESSGSAEMDLDKLGLTGGKKTFFETILSKLKGPLIVAVLFIIFSFVQVDDMFKQFLPLMILSNNYYYLAIKGLIVGAIYLATNLFIDE